MFSLREDFVRNFSRELGFTPTQTERLRENTRKWNDRLDPTIRTLEAMHMTTAADMAVMCNVTHSR